MFNLFALTGDLNFAPGTVFVAAQNREAARAEKALALRLLEDEMLAKLRANNWQVR